jgi:hypothetical protein
MAVREFNGGSDRLIRSIGNLNGFAYGTIAAILKVASVTGGLKTLFSFMTSGGTTNIDEPLTTTPTRMSWGGACQFDPNPLVTTTWYCMVLRKGTGSVIPRLSTYNYNSTSWLHDAGGLAVVDVTGIDSTDVITLDTGAGSESWNGRVAVQAAWTNEVHWTADASGDTAIEAAGLETALQNWIDETPDALWPFNQASTSEPVDDIIGGADQSSLTGTTVVTGDDPPGFTFSLTPGPSLIQTRSNLTLA